MNHLDYMSTGAFQEAVGEWMMNCFGKEISLDQTERADRFLEESLELAQTMPGMTAERAHKLVDYVFSRPVGEPGQEIGGVMITLAALVNTLPMILSVQAYKELDRITQPENITKIRLKQASKPDFHGPLPSPASLDDAVVVDQLASYFSGSMVAAASIGLQLGGHALTMAQPYFAMREALGIKGYATHEEAAAAIITAMHSKGG